MYQNTASSICYNSIANYEGSMKNQAPDWNLKQWKNQIVSQPREFESSQNCSN